MYRESGGRSMASHLNSNGTYDYGCMQLNSIHLGTRGWYTASQAYDPEWNIQYALKIFRERGWRAWYGAEGLYWK